MKKVCFVQPLIAKYSLPLYAELAVHWRLIIIFSPVDADKGYGDQLCPRLSRVKWHEVPTLRPLGERIGMYQSRLIQYLRKERPDAVILFANLRYLSFWIALFWCRIRGIPVYPHGHGLYRRGDASFVLRAVYQLVVRTATKYICYTPSVAESLLRQGLPEKQIAVADNSVENPFPVLPEEKSPTDSGILFIGRLRHGCKLDVLIKVIAQLREIRYPALTLHVIGGGEQSQHFQQIASGLSWVRFHGQIHDPEKIREISRNCMFGCYPGNAGLSVVHLMSLSLPPVTHDDLAAHEGPEPSYIQHGINGWFFTNRDPEGGLLRALHDILENPQRLKLMQRSAFATYKYLMKPSLAMRFVNIVGT